MNDWWRNEKGFSTTVFAICLPVILAFLALCVDGAVLIYYRIALGTASDAASLAAIDSYNREVWYSEGKVVLDKDIAEPLVREILHANFPEARLVEASIPELEQNTFQIITEVDAPLHFLKLFGIEARTIRMTSLAHGYS